MQPIFYFYVSPVSMCGIVAYVGNKNCKNILLNGLKQLEYRGYDSAGVSVLDHGKIVTTKAVGKVEELIKRTAVIKNDGSIGIAHTRWATHGGVTEKNAHPHHDCKNTLALLHNGIIENYAGLKKSLQKSGHKFRSETDTEVLAHLIEKYYKGNLLAAVANALQRVVGTYGIAVIHRDHPNEIVVARNGSPLILGIGKNFTMAASDVAAIVEHTDRVVYLQDGEVALIRPDEFVLNGLNKEKIERDVTQVEMKMESALLGNYKHFMLKEIEEQPLVLRDTLAGRMVPKKGAVILGGLQKVETRLRKINKIILVSCGTASYACQYGKYLLEEKTEIEALVESASEFRYKKTNANPETTAVLFVSQSGETADTIAALKESKRKGFLTLGIVNVVGSTLAREVDAGIYTHAGFEIGVASTKAFTSQMAALVLVVVYLARMRNMSVMEAKEILEELTAIPKKMEQVLHTQKKKVQKLAQKYAKYNHMFFLGRKFSYPIALEGALKLKEISYIHAEAYPAGEMKHGPIALIDPNFPSCIIVPQDDVYDKTLNAIAEIKARQGKVLAIVTKGDKKASQQADDSIEVIKTLPILSPLLTVLPLQLFAYYVADFLKRPIDKPRNLAKSVTVE